MRVATAPFDPGSSTFAGFSGCQACTTNLQSVSAPLTVFKSVIAKNGGRLSSRKALDHDRSLFEGDCRRGDGEGRFPALSGDAVRLRRNHSKTITTSVPRLAPAGRNRIGSSQEGRPFHACRSVPPKWPWVIENPHTVVILVINMRESRPQL